MRLGGNEVPAGDLEGGTEDLSTYKFGHGELMARSGQEEEIEWRKGGCGAQRPQGTQANQQPDCCSRARRGKVNFE